MAYPPETKNCQRPGCTNLCVRRPKEAPSTWSIRQFCGVACAAWKPPVEERPCGHAGCPAVLTRHDGESYRDFAKRRYCSPECFYAKRREAATPRGCARDGCPNTLLPRQGEVPSHFARRLYCSIACANACKIRPGRPSPKPCLGPACTNQIVPRPKDGQKGFALKKYCCNACKLAAQARDRALTQGPISRPRAPAPRLRKPCRIARCSGEVVQKPNESRGKYDKRHYCSPACLKEFLREGANVERLKAARQRALTERRIKADNAAKAAGFWKHVRRKGNLRPCETRIAPALGEAERAAQVLQRHGPVWPELVENPKSKMWIVWGRRMAPDEMIELARRKRAA